MTTKFYSQKNIYKTEVISLKRRGLVWSLSSLFIIFISLYIYLVNVAILHTAERQEVQSYIADLRSNISEKQEKLLAIRQDVIKNSALEQGFVEVSDSHFVYRSTDSRLSLR